MLKRKETLSKQQSLISYPGSSIISEEDKTYDILVDSIKKSKDPFYTMTHTQYGGNNNSILGSYNLPKIEERSRVSVSTLQDM